MHSRLGLSLLTEPTPEIEIGVTIALDVLKALVAMAVPDTRADKVMLEMAKNAVAAAR